ncbi:MAG TPA: cation transporter [Acidimicrobiia bacterium]|nr:cation transporter [Acidimicrobiia bacterium]
MTAHSDVTRRRRGLLLEYLTIGWNVVEAVVAVAAGLAAGSIALVGFGFDSTIEVAAASVVVWQFRAELRGGVDEERERRALKRIAITFFVLAAYVTVEAVRDLLGGEEAQPSTVGIVLAVVSLVVMPALAWMKWRTGVRLKSRTLVADSAETLLCAWLSAILVVGLVLNAAVSWWWADPVAALGIAWLAVREGVEAWQGEVLEEA